MHGRAFLRQVLYGCVRYKDALRVFLKHYYNDMASSVLRGDFTLYMVLGYLLLFRLDELGFGDFRRLTSSEDPTKMAQLLNYLIDWERMEVGAKWLSETTPHYGCFNIRLHVTRTKLSRRMFCEVISTSKVPKSRSRDNKAVV